MRRWAVLALGACLCLAGQPASAQTAETSTAAALEAREADLFGTSDDEADREAGLFGMPVSADDLEATLFGAGTSSAAAAAGSAPYEETPRRSVEDRLADEMADREDPLAVGGQLWLWIQAAKLRNTPWDEVDVASPSFMDVYLDARPNDRLRAYARGRVNYDPTIDPNAPSLTGIAPQQTRARLDQLWLKFDLWRRVFVTAGKQRIRWGTGRIWNPTDFLNPLRRDSLDFLDVRLGVSLVKVHVPIESLGWNFYAIAALDGADTVKDVGGALRAEVLVGPAEVALSAALQRDLPVRLGADVSMPVWEFDLRVEAALVHDVRRPFFDEASDASFIRDIDVIADVDTAREVFGALQGTPLDRSDDWIPQIVVGVDYTVKYNDEDTLVLSLEYFFNDAGTDLTGTYLPLLFSGGFEALYVGRHYVSAAAVLVAPGDWDDSSISLVGLANLSDRSGLVRLNYTVRVLTYLTVNAFAAAFLGPAGGEFTLQFRVPPVDPELVDGLDQISGTTIPTELTGGLSFEPPHLQMGFTLVLTL